MKPKEVVSLSLSTLFQQLGFETIIETHISWLLICKEYAFKIKKPVKFSFLDYSTLSNRKKYCELEFELNDQYSPTVYEKVVAIRQHNADFFLEGNAPIIEYAVLMKRLNHEFLLTNILKHKKNCSNEALQRLADRIYNIHTESKKSIIRFNQSKFLIRIAQITFLQEDSAEIFNTSELKIIDDYLAISKAFLFKNTLLFDDRIQQGFIRNTHGDLHAGNIFLYPNHVHIIDCIEFKEAYKTIDILDDLATLLIDFEVYEQSNHSQTLEKLYFKHYNDLPSPKHTQLLTFYKLQKAITRCSTHILAGKSENRKLAKLYLKLANGYIQQLL